MKWVIVLMIGFTLGAFVFVPKFRDIVLEIAFGDMIVRVCPGDNGVILNGSLQLPSYARENLVAVCTDQTAQFKSLIQEAEQTSWSEYLSADDSGLTTLAILEAEDFLIQNNWVKTREGIDTEIYKVYFEKDNKKIMMYTFDNADKNNHMLLITGD